MFTLHLSFSSLPVLVCPVLPYCFTSTFKVFAHHYWAGLFILTDYWHHWFTGLDAVLDHEILIK